MKPADHSIASGHSYGQCWSPPPTKSLHKAMLHTTTRMIWAVLLQRWPGMSFKVPTPPLLLEHQFTTLSILHIGIPKSKHSTILFKTMKTFTAAVMGATALFNGLQLCPAPPVVLDAVISSAL